MNVKIKKLTKTYQDKLILDINELEFNQNKTYCIRGRNGTGKTTLMQIIANLLVYDTGEVLYDGKLITNEIMQEITYVKQNPYIFSNSVFENLVYPLKLREYQNFDKKVDVYLKFFELEDIKYQNAKKCSSGEKMKIALARALILEPKLLLLDEPTTNLDIESINKLKNKILELKKNLTIIFISHDMHFIEAISDAEILLKNTKVIIGDRYV